MSTTMKVVARVASKALPFVIATFEEFREIDPKFPIQRAVVFSYVAANPDCTLQEIEQALAIQQSTASMIVLALSNGAKPGEEGMDLVETYTGLEDRRTKRVRLTAKGRRLAGKIEQHFERIAA
jgi:DNA-binding MarR family transcriptional regulator